MTNIKRLWHDPVWSKVFAGAILAVIGLIGSYFLKWWGPIGRTCKVAFEYFGESSTLSNWVLLILWLFFAAMVLLIGIVTWAKFILPPDRPNWLSYKSDEFFGIRWRWCYGTGNQILNLCSFCPKCDYQIFPDSITGHNYLEQYIFHCDYCGYISREFEESPNSINSKVERFIQQKIRNDSWVKRSCRHC